MVTLPCLDWLKTSLSCCWAISRVMLFPTRAAYALSFIRAASRSRTFVEMFLAMMSVTSVGTGSLALSAFFRRMAQRVS